MILGATSRYLDGEHGQIATGAGEECCSIYCERGAWARNAKRGSKGISASTDRSSNSL